MNIIRILDRRAMYLAMAFVLVLMSLVLPAMASAAQITTRSIALSSSSKAATNVSYEVTFTPAENAGAFVVDFCSNSPVVGSACTAASADNFDATAADSASAGVTDVTGAASQFVVEVPLVADTPITVEVTGIDNPDTAGPLYARVVTYDNEANALLYESETLGSGVQDTGSIAISITDSIGVTGSVLESMLFCVASEQITADCGDAADNPPTIGLGSDVGGTTALDPGQLSTGILYTQISTNAAGGAVVSLKSDAEGCGGLLRLGDEEECYIAPALATGIAAGEAKFGLLVGAAYATDGVANATGTLQAVTGSGYNDTTYALNYVDGDATGVTSAYGDPLLDTNNLPANNQNADITFGASVSNDTPAGSYAANLSMIATGRF